MAREVSALMGERAPPISMIHSQPKYKQRPRRSHRPTPWRFESFTNPARNDGLVLHHWARKQPSDSRPADSNSADHVSNSDPDPSNSSAPPYYQFAKYDVHVQVPSYSDHLYDTSLQDPDWSKEETDYLVQLVADYAQKWPVVVDRYDFHNDNNDNDDNDNDKNSINNDSDNTAPKPRSMEQLKHRYYTVSAKVLAHETPISSMNTAQYNLYSTLHSFNPVQETARKKLAEGHLYRSQVEVDEETVLLAELQRIMINQQQLDNERKEIRERLEFPISTSSTSGVQYSTSQALGSLFQQLVQADRVKKDRKFKNLPDYPNATPSSAQASTTASQSANRDSSAITQPARKPTGAGRDSTTSTSDPSRHLSPHSEQRYFVTHHDRLSSGVSFASDKLHKPRTAKSTVQTERIAAALAHLKIPEVIPLPTQKVIEEFDKLMQKVNALLDLRKVAEKEQYEINVKSAEKTIKAEKESAVHVKEERRASTAQSQEGAPQVAGQKRSASVMSETGNQSTKRPRM